MCLSLKRFSASRLTYITTFITLCQHFFKKIFIFFLSFLPFFIFASIKGTPCSHFIHLFLSFTTNLYSLTHIFSPQPTTLCTLIPYFSLTFLHPIIYKDIYKKTCKVTLTSLKTAFHIYQYNN